MQIESLRCFVELAQAGSFYRAAKRLFISHQGLIRILNALESELGVKLIERSRNGVRLTNAGEIFLEYAQDALKSYSGMLGDLYAENRFANPGESQLVFHVTYYPAQTARPFITGLGAMETVRIAEEPFAQVVQEAASSDGSELFLIDAYECTWRSLTRESGLIFEPIVVSQFGIVWQDGSPLGGQRAIHREQLANFPLATDSHREMRKLIEYVMEDYPLNNIRLGVAQPRTTLDFALKSKDAASTFDSFGFLLAQASPLIPTDGLNFTPFSTPRSLCRIGFVYAKGARPNVRARHAIELLKGYLHQNYAEYFKSYPIE